jgi:hypothetical protein
MRRVEFDLESDRFEIVKGFFPLSLSFCFWPNPCSTMNLAQQARAASTVRTAQVPHGLVVWHRGGQIARTPV